MLRTCAYKIGAGSLDQSLLMGHQIKATTVTNVRNGTTKIDTCLKIVPRTTTSRDSGSGTKIGYRRLPMQWMGCAKWSQLIKKPTAHYLFLFLLFLQVCTN